MEFGSPAEKSLRDGDPVAALALLQEAVRTHPADAKLRVFLFQLLCVLGQWARALNQLEVAAGLDPAALAMKQTYGEAIRCELMRAQVFAGKKSPMVFGEPEQWIALLIESLLVSGHGKPSESERLRNQAFADAPAVEGEIDGQKFTWIADADSRLGPVLEAVINGRYYWVPFSRLTQIVVEPPEDLRDMVWMPAHLQFDNGGDSVALLPTRYAGSETSQDGLIMLARKTIWEPLAATEGCDAYRGLGQRLLTTDEGEWPLMAVRSVTLNLVDEPDNGDG
jgi:type VI secretion system protein ImpE